MKKNNKAFCTIIIIAINVIVFALMSIVGSTQNTNFLYECGGMYVPAVLKDGEFYRVITHMFLHSGYQHIFYNMIMLGAVGLTLEEKIGHIKFLIIYFIGGIGATAMSGWYDIARNSYDIARNSYPVGVGASGAIMAVFGALMITTVKDSRRNKSVELRRTLIVLAIMVLGNTGPGVDWMAHLGGAVTGVILGLLLYRGREARG